MRTRTIDGQKVFVHQNGGLRKRCTCPRRAWAKCSHPWHFSFKWRGVHHRFQLDKYAAEPVTSKDDAKTEADRLRALIRSGAPFPPPAPSAPAVPSDLSFSEFARLWLERARASKPRQRQDDESKIARLGAVLVDGQPLGARAIGRITQDDVEAVLAVLGTLSGSTFNKYLDALCMLQAWGVDKGYLVKAWFRKPERGAKATSVFKRRKGGKRERRLVPDVLDDQGKVIAPGEEARLLAVAGPWLWRLIVASLETCCRLGELLTLQWKDVDLQRGEVRILAAKAKSREMRRLPVSARLRGVLEMVRHDPAGKPHKPDAYVFGNLIGERVGSPKKAWETVVLRAYGHTPEWTRGRLSAASRARLHEIDLHFHDLRHEAGSRLLEAGWPLQAVQAMLGHADAKTTSIYLNTSAVHLQDAMKRYGTGACLPGRPLHNVAQTPAIDPRPAVLPGSAVAGKVLVN